MVDNRRPTTEMLIPANDVDWNEFTIENIYNWCKTADISEFGRAKEAVAMNKILAQDGIDNPRGIQTARVLMDNIESGFVAPDEITHILIWPPPVRMPAWAAVIIPPWSALPAATRRYGCHGPLGLCGVPQVLGGGRLPRGRLRAASQYISEVSLQGICLHAPHLLLRRHQRTCLRRWCCLPPRPESQANQ